MYNNNYWRSDFCRYRQRKPVFATSVLFIEEQQRVDVLLIDSVKLKVCRYTKKNLHTRISRSENNYSNWTMLTTNESFVIFYTNIMGVSFNCYTPFPERNSFSTIIDINHTTRRHPPMFSTPSLSLKNMLI